MKKLTYLFLLFAISSCAKKKWDREYISDKCIKEAKKDKSDAMKQLSADQLDKICDCAADKILVKYKSEAEAEKDEAGGKAIGTECAMQVLMPGQDNTTPPVQDDTTSPDSDTTDQ